jgi:hypothetical protein
MLESASMLSHSRLAASATACAVALALPTVASAAPPRNDNYLASTSISAPQRPLGPTFTDAVDTTDATTQGDLFNPDNQGRPLTGGGPEPTTCGATSFGKTVWWDFWPQRAGAAEVKAVGGFDLVVAVYEWSTATSKITRLVTCQNASPDSEDVALPNVRKGHYYTVQVGGAGDTGGHVQFSLDYVPARLARIKVQVAYVWRPVGASTKLSRLVVKHVPRRATVKATCVRGCSRRKLVRRAAHGTVSLKRLVRHRLAPGTRISIVVSRPDRVAAIKTLTVRAHRRPKITTRCLAPGSTRPRRCT